MLRARCLLVLISSLALASPALADPSDSLPAACAGVFGGVTFGAGVHLWDGTDEEPGFSDEGGGSFHHVPNWFPGQGVPGPSGVPTFGGHPCLEPAGGQLVALGAFAGAQDPVATPGSDVTNLRLEVLSGRFDLDLGGQTYSLTDPTGPLLVGADSPFTGSPGDAELRITGGTLSSDVGSGLNSQATIGLGSGSRGSVVLSGSDTHWDAGPVWIGQQGGSGELRVENGATLVSQLANRRLIVVGDSSTPGSSGTTTVSGSGSSWRALDTVVLSAGGSLTIEDGGFLDAARNVTALGGEITVRDSGSWIDAGELRVQGGGDLLVESGGLIDAGSITLLETALVTGAGSSVSSRGDSFHRGDLRIEDGAAFSTRRGAEIDSGTVTLSGAGSTWTSGQSGSASTPWALEVGLGATPATLRVETGALLEVLPSVELQIAPGGRVELGGGSALLGDPGPVPAPGELRILDGASFGPGGGSLVGDVRSAGLMRLDRPTLPFGVFQRTFTLEGDLILEPTSELRLRAGRNSVFDSDRVDVLGQAVLDGALEMSFVGGPASNILPGEVFTVLEAGSPLSGVFSNVASGDRLMDPGFGAAFWSFDVFYGPGSPYGANRVVVTNALFFVPEPTTLLLLGSGLAVLALRRRRP